jgi:prevent-host-death family protein
MYIIAVNAVKYTMILMYTAAMSATKKESQEKIADFRNSLAEAIEKARYYDETTVLTSRGKRVAVLVGMDFYERALEALGEERVLEVDDLEDAPKRKVVRLPRKKPADSD